MAEKQRDTFKLHLPGLLKVLAEHLYSNKQVAVRELLQNAHDSCVRRLVEGNEADYQPRIDINLDAKARTLTISDNGFGLTGQEIADYLSTIGRSYTRELRENLSLLSPDEAGQLIGQFGFGFLSAFLIAGEVTVVTRSVRDEQAHRWRSQGDEHYDLEPAQREVPGTTIELLIKSSASFVLREEMLIDIVRQYADFLPIPIYLNGDSVPLNLMAPPWQSEDEEAASFQYIERAFRLENPLCVIPLRDHRIEMEHDTLIVPLSGFLFVPPATVASIGEYGDLMVFIRRMFILNNEKHLLPPWARFVRGVIDCPHLQPTASREDVHQDETFEAVQQALEEQLGAALQQIALEDPAVWAQIVRGHTDVIMGWAARDNEFFDKVADIITLRTSRGALSLPDYLEQSGGKLYFVTRELGSLQEQLLAEGHGVPVIDASWFAVQPFLAKYAAREGDLPLVQLDGDAQALLRPANSEPFLDVLAWFEKRGVRARVAEFKPRSVPALMLYPRDAEFLREARRARESGPDEALPDALAGLVDAYVEETSRGRDDLQGTLFLNASCPLMRRVAEEKSESRDAVLTLVHQMARLFAGRMMDADDATLAFEEAGQALEQLLG